jgi:hypothetical protein
MGAACGSKKGDWRDVNPSINQSISYLLETGLYADVEFKVGQSPLTETIRGHKLIIMSRSEVFATMLEERWSNSEGEGKKNKAEIDLTNDVEITAKSFRLFLKVRNSDQKPKIVR